MSKEDTMTETEKLAARLSERLALAKAYGPIGEGREVYIPSSDLEAAVQALTAWNTRPDADCAPPVEPCRECAAVSAAIGGVKFMDPPDGGDVSLSEQVRRMRQTRYTRPAPALDREGVVACIRDAADRGFEAGKAGAIHFRFPDIIARVDALLSASTVEG
jgi:hypothetical protein